MKSVGQEPCASDTIHLSGAQTSPQAGSPGRLDGEHLS
jgi:hypothetical protein